MQRIDFYTASYLCTNASLGVIYLETLHSHNALSLHLTFGILLEMSISKFCGIQVELNNKLNGVSTEYCRI